MRTTRKLLIYAIGALLALAAMVGVSATVLGLVSAGSAGAAGPCSDTFANTTGDGQWATAGNWSTHAVPGATDWVCFASGAGSVTFNTSSTSILGVFQANSVPLVISGGTLTVTDTATGSSFAGVTVLGGALQSNGPSTATSVYLQGGTIDGAGTIADAGAFNWTGGYLGTGNGTLTVAGATTIALSDATTQYSIGQYTLTANGTATVSGAPLDPGFLEAYQGIINFDGATATIQDGVELLNNAGNSALNVGASTVLTAGSGSSPFVYLSVYLNNAGTVDVPANGTLDVLGGTSSGTFVPAAGSTIALSNVTLSGTGTDVNATAAGGHSSTTTLELAGDTIAGGIVVGTLETNGGNGTNLNGPVDVGTLDVTNGTFSFNGNAVSFSVLTTVAVSGGTLEGSGTITDAGTFSWTSGYLGTGNGTLTVAGATTIALSDATVQYQISQYTLTANGTATVSGAPLDPGFLEAYQGIINFDGATATIQDGVELLNNAGNSALNVGASTVLTAGSGSSPFVYLSVYLNNAGTVDVPANGTLDVLGGTSSGTFVPAAGSTIALSNVTLSGTGTDVNATAAGGHSSTTTLELAGDTITGGIVVGTLETNGGNGTNLNGPVDVGTLDVTNGTFSFNGNAVSFSVLTTVAVSGGTLEGSGTITDAGTFSWTSGYLGTGNGTLNVAGATTIALSQLTVQYQISQYTLTANGTATVSGAPNSPGFLEGYQGIINLEGSTATIQSGVELFTNSGNSQLNVGASTVLTAGSGSASSVYLDVYLGNAGTVDIPANGSLEVYDGTSSGTFVPAAGSTMVLANMTLSGTGTDVNATAAGGDASSTTLELSSDTITGGIVVGTLETNGGNGTNLNGPVDVGTLDVTNGTFSFNGNAVSFSVLTTVAVSGGTLEGSGTITDAGTFSWTSGYLGTGNGTLNVAGATTIALSQLTVQYQISQYTLTANGTATVSGAPNSPGFLEGYQGIINLEGSTATIQSGVELFTNSGNSQLNVGASTVLTAGSGSASSVYLDVYLGNAGTVDIPANGSLEVYDGTSSGTFVPASGSTMVLANMTLSGTGTDVNATAAGGDASTTTLELSGDTIAGGSRRRDPRDQRRQRHHLEW